MDCTCRGSNHGCRLVVLTGGPGAGKTAVLEVVRRNFCEHVAVLPEAASILFGGGFPRRDSLPARREAQRVIWHVQRGLERIVVDEGRAAVALCDRGTIDGAAYWPGPIEAYWTALGTSLEAELARYAAVIHLRTPSAASGYNNRNPVRTESPLEAAAIDERIAAAWSAHPHRFFVENSPDFVEKLARAIALIRAEVPSCCRSHPVAELSSVAPVSAERTMEGRRLS